MDNTFTLKNGQRITLDLNILHARRLKEQLALDVFAADFFEQIQGDIYRLVDAVHMVSGLDMSGEEFASQLTGAGLEEAGDAFIAAVINFIQPQRGKILRTLWDKARAVEQEVTRRMMDAAQKIEPLPAGN